jgi:hypothetical protein
MYIKLSKAVAATLIHLTSKLGSGNIFEPNINVFD